MKKFINLSFLTLLLFSSETVFAASDLTFLHDLEIRSARSAVGEPKSKTDLNGNGMDIAGEDFEQGVTFHPPHNVRILLDAKSESFRAKVGVDDDSNKRLKNKSRSFVRFVVLGDGVVLFDRVMFYGEPAAELNLDVKGVKELNLITEEPEKVHHKVMFHAVWADAVVEGGRPKVLPLDHFLLTPAAPPSPQINSAKVFGLRPGSPLLYTIATSGQRPMTFSAQGLPKGVSLDAEHGQLRGSCQELGEHKILLSASNSQGRDEMEMTLRVGDEIALTPPMGWNSWYCWSESVSQEKIVAVAKGFVDKGLIDYGWSYVNIDDCWGGPERDGPHHALQGNERFPDMKAMVDEVHGMGLKVGLYSTLWMSSFGGFIGGTAPNPEGDYRAFHATADKVLQSGQIFGRCPTALKSRAATIGPYWFVDHDVKQFTDWGFDYVKYDWNERHNQEELMAHIRTEQKLPKKVKRYVFDEDQRKYAYWTRRFHDSFRASERDMVLSLSPRSTYSSGQINSTYSNLWRTTNDIVDTWVSVSESFKNDHWRKFQRPGHWNDPDMLQVGNKGIPNEYVRTLSASRLTPDEQYTQMSLWSIIAAPLLISCDIETMDDFTLNLLTNREVLAVNQDPLGLQGYPVVVDGDVQIWRRELSDGRFAIGLFNLGYGTKEIELDFDKLGMVGLWKLRDCWRQIDLGEFKGACRQDVRGHGSFLIVASPKRDIL